MADLVTNLGGPDGFGTGYLAPNDDGSTGAIDITSVFGGGLNFFGHTYNQIYINNNGNITLQSALGTYTPTSIGSGYTAPIIAPYWADVDTNGGTTSATGGNSKGTDLVWYSLDATNHILTVTWDDVGYYKSHTDKSDAFQLQLVGKGNGNFDIVFRYQNISWTTGDASNGSGGLGGTPAREGYSAGDGTHYYELPGSGTQGSDLALATSTGNAGQAGVWTFPVMNGNVVPVVSIKETAGSIVNLNQGHTAIFDVEVDGNLSHADWQAIPGGTLVVTLKPNVHLLDTRVEAAPVVGPPEPVFAVDTQYGSDWSLPATQITFNEADFHNGSAVKTVSADVYDNPAGADPATSFFTVG